MFNVFWWNLQLSNVNKRENNRKPNGRLQVAVWIESALNQSESTSQIWQALRRFDKLLSSFHRLNYRVYSGCTQATRKGLHSKRWTSFVKYRYYTNILYFDFEIRCSVEILVNVIHAVKLLNLQRAGMVGPVEHVKTNNISNIFKFIERAHLNTYETSL